ncbi:MAG: HPr family phosphocarrier protein [Sandaracinaceae bacterium]|nr:HPr family phosphocarrier protein [Sandaracinaceae bacterium]
MRAEGLFEITNELGMHARAAAKLVRLASEFTSSIVLEKDGQRADAKSVMGVLLLCGQKGAKLRIEATGDDAEQAIEALGELIRDRFGEER